MIRLVRAEWTKLFTTRVWIGLLLGACVLVGGFAALLHRASPATQSGQPGIPPVGTRAVRAARPRRRPPTPP